MELIGGGGEPGKREGEWREGSLLKVADLVANKTRATMQRRDEDVCERRKNDEVRRTEAETRGYLPARGIWNSRACERVECVPCLEARER